MEVTYRRPPYYSSGYPYQPLIAQLYNSTLFFSLSFIYNLGKVLVHCQMGISRSSTCAIAYLMINKKMSAADAIRTVRLRRDILPNVGFLEQLADLDNELRRERQYKYAY